MKQHAKKIALFATLAVCLGGLAYAIALKANPEGATAVKPEGPGAAIAPQARPRMDVAFVIDATGSMGDEIDNIKAQVATIAKQLASGTPTPDVRFGLVLYKDKGDDFVVKTTPLTRDVDSIEKLLREIAVSGGGDNPEHVGRGLHAALDMQWDAKAGTRTIYLVGDAPAHTDYNDGFDLDSALKRASEQRIVINTIGCSGISTGGGNTQFADIASRTQGTYEPLTYQAVVTDDDGSKKSIIVYDGEAYEADGVIDKDEWTVGGAEVIKKRKLKRARPKMRRKAKKKGFDNNLGVNIELREKKRAKSLDVTF